MVADHSQTVAVLMGDIVGSEDARSGSDLNRAFNAAIDNVNSKRARHIASPLTITLGDEFQGLTYSLQSAVEIASDVGLELRLEGIDCRFVAGLVHLETRLNRRKAWNMMGKGLPEARRKLNDKKNFNRLRFSLPDDPVLERLLDAVGNSISQTEHRWTTTQLGYAARRRRGHTASEIAMSFRIDTGSVYKALRAAQWDYLEAQYGALRFALQEIDRRTELAP